MKKTLYFFSFICFLFLFVGCNQEQVKVENQSENTNSMVHEHCSRVGSAGAGNSVSLEYDLYYQGDVLQLLQSHEEVFSSDQELLDTYENAYRSIHNNYKNLEYYETSLVRNDASVSSNMTIDYGKINIEQLIEIEGEEDNIFENNVPLVSKWKELAKRVGTKCEVVSN